jgi:hypothetical protein
VSSLNALEGDLTITAGDNILTVTDGSDIAVSASIGVSSLNALDGDLTITAGDGVNIVSAGTDVAISATFNEASADLRYVLTGSLETQRVNDIVVSGTLKVESDFTVSGSQRTVGSGSFGGVVISQAGFAASGSSFPSNPLPGQKFYHLTDALEYYYDSSRGKWLSTSIFQLGSAHNASLSVGSGFETYDNLVLATSAGYNLPLASTLVMSTLSYTGTSRTGHVRYTSTNTYDLAFSSSNQASDTTANQDFPAGAGGAMTYNAGNGSIGNPIFIVWYRFSGSI